MADTEIVVGNLPGEQAPVSLPELNIPLGNNSENVEKSVEDSGLINEITPPANTSFDDDFDYDAQYLEERRIANAPSSAAWQGAASVGLDPGEVVLGKPIFDYIEERTDGEQIVKVGIDLDNPENSVVLEVIEDIAAGVGKGIAKGIQDAGNQIGDTLTNGFWSATVKPWMNDNVPFLDDANKAADEALKTDGKAEEITAGFVAPLAQVLLPGALLSRSFRAAGVASRILAETMGYSAAEIASINPKDKTLIELGLQLIDDDPEIQSLVEKAFAAQEAESDLMRRIKNMPRKVIEGGVTGVVAERAFEGIGLAYRAMKNSRAWKDATQKMDDNPIEEVERNGS